MPGPSHIDQLLSFAKGHPWHPQHPLSLLRRFLTDFISSEKLIYEKHDEKGPLVCAVLLDQVNNPANDACLEILGMRADADRRAIVAPLIQWAKSSVPKHRAGFQVGLTEDLVTPDLVHYYDTYLMERADLTGVTVPAMANISMAVLSDQDQVYDVLCRSFAQNPDTCIPEAALWKKSFLQSPQTHFYVWRAGSQILGFATLAENENRVGTEVRTIGVLPESRGQGIGQALLEHCLAESVRLGHGQCQLTVAVTNLSALNLYLRAGFKSIEVHKCYRMALS